MTAFSPRGATVLVTGAAMGMGRLYALRAARAGAAAVALWDVDGEALSGVAAEVEASGTTALARRVDVSSYDGVRQAAAELTGAVGTVDLLINNAGIVRGGPFWEHDPVRDIGPVMAVNSLAPMLITRELLPAMMADSSRQRRILTIASAAGTLANPNMSVYAASKWAMIGWSDSLRLELQAHGAAHLRVTTFCPSYVSTGMFAGVRPPLMTPLLSPEVAVDRAWHAMLAGRPIKLTPWTAVLARGLAGTMPTSAFDVVAGRIFKVYRSMDHFTGRTGGGAGEGMAGADVGTEGADGGPGTDKGTAGGSGGVAASVLGAGARP
ncbi:MAG: SDR family NAD(P)-dependent oxidoreductase [Actinomycetales bacterium]